MPHESQEKYLTKTSMETSFSETVQNLVQTILQRIGFDSAVIAVEADTQQPNRHICRVTVQEDSNLLIGQHGSNLEALQHLIRLLVKKQLPEHDPFFLDINGYWEQKSLGLIREAREAAEQALRDQAPVLLRPMNNHERRIVHTELSNRSEVVTESVGSGDQRKVAVKPAALV